MRTIALIILFFQLIVVHSQTIEVKLIDSIPLKADAIVGIDSFENFYYTIGNTIYKKSETNTYSYTNIQLGTIGKVDITNPLKILVFYQGFNTAVILDNRLNELTDLINFSSTNYGKNVSDISISSNNNLWLYSLDDNVLTLWNYESKKSIFESQPLSFYYDNFESLYQVSGYEYCWLISKEGILKFNEFGNFISHTSIEIVKNLRPYQRGFLYVADNKLYFNDSERANVEIIIGPPKLKLDQFFSANEYLYFFNRNVIHKYSILEK